MTPVNIQLSIATIVTTATKQHGSTYTKQDPLHPKIKHSGLYPILFIDHYDAKQIKSWARIFTLMVTLQVIVILSYFQSVKVDQDQANKGNGDCKRDERTVQLIHI